MELIPTIGYRELSGSVVTWNDIESRIRQLPLVSCLHFLSQLNEALGADHLDVNVRNDVLQEAIIRKYRTQVTPLLMQGHALFYAHQVLATMNLVLLWAHREPGGGSVLRALSASEESMLADVLVAVTDLINTHVGCHTEEVKFLLQRWTMSHVEPIPSQLTRWRYMLTTGSRTGPAFDLNPLFEAVTGFDVATYFDAGFLLYLGFFQNAWQQGSRLSAPYIVGGGFFRHSAPALAVLRAISTTLDDMVLQVQPYATNPEPLLYLSKHLQLRPVIQFSTDQFMVLSLMRLGERLTSGAYYTIVDTFQAKHPNNKHQVDTFMKWLGYAFQDYIADLMASVPTWRCTPEPFNATPPMADVTVETLKGAILVECKTKRIRVKAFEQGDLQTFRDDLRLYKGLKRSSSVSGGAEELSDRLRQIAAQKYTVSGLTTATTIPIVCTLEATPAILGLGREIDDIFHSVEWHGSSHLVLTCAFDLEMLVATQERHGDGLQQLWDWIPDVSQLTLADFLKGTARTPWMGSWQAQQWELAKAQAGSIFDYGQVPPGGPA